MSNLSLYTAPPWTLTCRCDARYQSSRQFLTSMSKSSDGSMGQTVALVRKCSNRPDACRQGHCVRCDPTELYGARSARAGAASRGGARPRGAGGEIGKGNG